jgi:hypothetical protein
MDPDLIQITLDKIKVIRDKLQTAQSRERFMRIRGGVI